MTINEFREILIKTSLSERRPIKNDVILGKMLKHCDILITAWDLDKIVGCARSISDFGYCTYLSDLSVHKDYQKMGIGKQLIRETIKLIENDSLLFLISAPSANEYYPRIGFKRIERAWYLEHNKISNENS